MDTTFYAKLQTGEESIWKWSLNITIHFNLIFLQGTLN